MLDFIELESLIETSMRAAIVPGLAIGIVQGDELTHARGYGVTSTDENAAPVTPDTLFRIGSVTKPLTGTMLMRLVESGALDLDAPAAEIGASGTPVTLRILLSHTSGLPTALAYTPSQAATLDEYARQVIPTLSPVAPPGTAYHYSNPGINLAAWLAEAATGKPYSQLMQELLFKPLAMIRTTFDPVLAMTYSFSQSFVLDAEARPVVKRPFVDNPSEYPCGFAFSSLRDLANFAILHLHDGCFKGQQILQPESVHEMHRPHAIQYTWDNRAYGLTFRSRDYKGVRIVGHNGAIAKYGAALAMIPERKIAVIVLANRAPNFWGALDRIISFVLDGLPELAPAARVPDSEPSATAPGYYTGAYLGASAGLALIEANANGLTLRLNGGAAIPLRTADGKLYLGETAGGGHVSVGFPQANGDYLMVDGMLCARFDYDPAFAPDWAAWARKYTGVYRGDVDTWTVRFEGGCMFIYSEDERAEMPCIPLSDDRFACAFGDFRFAGDGGGRALALHGGGGEWRFDRVEGQP